MHLRLCRFPDNLADWLAWKRTYNCTCCRLSYDKYPNI